MSGGVPGKYWQAPDGLHIDTRGLQPPDPLVAILWHIEKPDQHGPVIVYLDRNPIYLFPELTERGWVWEVAEDDPDAVRIILRAKK